MKKNYIFYLIFTIISFVLYIYTNNQVSFFLFMFLVIFYICNLLYVHQLKNHVSFSLSSVSTSKIEESMPINIKILNKTRLLINRIDVYAHYENVLFHSSRDEVYNVYIPFKKDEITIDHKHQYCGKLHLSIQRVVIYDLFGLCSCKVDIEEKTQYIVYPYYYQFMIELNQELYKDEMGDFYLQNKKGNETGEIFDLRDYQQGDSLKKVHWKMSSKYEDLIVKEFAHPSSFHTMIIYDGSLKDELETMNAMFGAIISTSDAFINKGVSHYVGYFDSELKRIAVESKNEFNEMVDSVLSSPVVNRSDLNVNSFISLNYAQEISSVLYFTNKINELSMSVLAEYTNVTVILLSQETLMYNNPQYRIISLDVNSLNNQLTSLFI